MVAQVDVSSTTRVTIGTALTIVTRDGKLGAMYNNCSLSVRSYATIVSPKMSLQVNTSLKDCSSIHWKCLASKLASIDASYPRPTPSKHSSSLYETATLRFPVSHGLWLSCIFEVYQNIRILLSSYGKALAAWSFRGGQNDHRRARRERRLFSTEQRGQKDLV